MKHTSKLRYEHLFFDLDDTLWDFSHNISITLEELYLEFGYQSDDKPFSYFLKTYKEINKIRWKEYQAKLITKEQLNVVRFYDTFSHLQIGNMQESKLFGELFLKRVPFKTALVPGAFEILEHFKERIGIHIITNGFSELQYIKLRESGLDKYIDTVTVSEHTGWQKPHKAIFEYAFNQAPGANPQNSLMIGDDFEADIIGGLNVGMDTAFLNPQNQIFLHKPTYNLSSLNELISIVQ